MKGDVEVTNAINVEDAFLECYGNLSTGDLSLRGAFWCMESVLIRGDLAVSGETIIFGSLEVRGSAHIFGSAKLDGGSRVGGTIAVAGSFHTDGIQARQGIRAGGRPEGERRQTR